MEEPDKPCDIPEYVKKGPCRIKILRKVVSGKATKYYNVLFIGEMIEHDGYATEIVPGWLEQDKKTGEINPNNIRLLRPDQERTDKQMIAAVYNMFGDQLRKK